MYKKVSNILCVAAFIGAMSLNSQTAFAQAPVPTLDRVKTEQSTFLKDTHQSYVLTELTGDETAPDGAITVNINDKTYYYTPTENTDVLKSLASTGSVALEVTTDPSKALYSVGDTYYTYNSDKLKGSGYNLTEAASADEPNTITLYDKTEVIKYYDPTTGAEVAEDDRQEGVEYKEVTTIQTTPKYYTVNLNNTKYGDQTDESAQPVYYKWISDENGNKQLTQDGASTTDYDIVYYTKTTYGDPNGTTTMIYGWEKNADTGNLEFKQDPAAPVGQTIKYSYNEDSFTQTIKGKPINESVTNPTNTSSSSPYMFNSGAGLNNPVDNTDIIDNVLYIGNKVTGTLASSTRSYKYAQVSGGAVYNAGELTSITGAFINNSVEASRTGSRSSYAYNSAYGGALYNSGTIGDITTDFIDNYASSEYQAYGGAIYNTGTIGDITSDFIGNHTFSSRNYAYGGAIYNTVTIGDITGDFIGNHTFSSSNYAEGGAIYNNDVTIGDITGDFIGNYASSTNFPAQGGAIFNIDGTIGDITGNFIGNYAFGISGASGGAIYNYRGTTIGDITGDFIGNYASGSSADGGAIFNIDGTIGDITGDFIGNYVSGDSLGYGGAIFNRDGTIGTITGDFIGNYASSTDNNSYSGARGGAIYNNYGTIGDITGDFIGNYASSTDSQATGGAIFNEYGTIGTITGDFISNYVSSTGSTDYAYGGGAISNVGSRTIGGITGDFIGNYASSTEYYAKGGAIYNVVGTIGNITGDFIGNYASSNNSYASGGTIYNDGIIGNITGDFIGNYASGGSNASGGAIYNDGIIGNITGDFIGNYTQSNSSYALGGAIHNQINFSYDTATIGLTNNNFLNNYAESNNGGIAKGGAIFTNYDLTLKADNGNALISGNYTESNGVKENNAIYVANFADENGVIERTTTFTLNAINNGKIQIDDTIAGGSYYASSNKFWETSDHAYTLVLKGDGTGTISLYNDVKNAKVTSNNVTVDFANGETRNYNFVSMTAGENTKLNLDVDFSNQTADTITTQNASTGTLIINAINELGSADGAVTVQIIKNTDPSSSLQLALGDNFTEVAQDFVFDKNYVEHTDKFMQEGGLSLATTDTTNDSITIVQEKLFDTLHLINSYETSEDRTFQFADSSKYTLSEDLNPTTEGVLNINGVSASAPSTLDANSHTLFNLQNATTLNINNTTIENAKDFAIKAENINSVVNLTNTSLKNTDGTAIQSNVDVNITADSAKSEFSGNTSAIQMNDASKSVNMNAINSGEIVLSDIIDGATGYSIKLNGDDKSKITVNNNINNANISLDNTNLYLSKETYFDNSQTLTLNSGAMYLNNNAIGTMHIPTLNLNGTTNLSVDVDLQNEVMDRITADTYNVTQDALLNVTDLNLLSTTEKENVKILFADEPLANNVEYTGDSPVSYKGTNTVYSPIYKYDVQYGVDENDKLGYFFFNRAASGSGSNGNISDAFNPSVLASPVATQAGAYTTQLQTFNYAFQHADTFMNIPYLERVAMINQNKYALSPTGDATDVGTYSPLLLKEESAGFWVKPYASFENVPLKNGPKVSNINYGTLIGYDSPLKTISHGFERVLTGYIGYNGASQRYSGVDAYQNGGLIGGTATFYKGNFFNATTLSVGATAGDASTMYGSENYTMLLAGIGNKTGYNFEFWDGKMILQPNFLISYTFVNTFDYNNAAGVRIESDPLHAIQLSPGLKLIGNTKNGWQPYIGVNMVWNLLDDSRVTANDVRLPEMSIRPYVQYGVGIQKRFKDKFLAFGQAMIHNGGRNGVSLTAGLRWKVGRE